MAVLERAAAIAAGEATTVRGKLRISVDRIFSHLILGPRLEAFLAEHPTRQLELIARDQLGEMITDAFDPAVRFGEPRNYSLIVHELPETPVLIVAAPSYLKRCGRPLTPRDLARSNRTCIEFCDAETGRPFAREFHRKRKQIVVETDSQLTGSLCTLLGTCLVVRHCADLELDLEHLLTEGN